MSAILRVLDAEIAKYEMLVKQLKASRQAIAAAEGSAAAGRASVKAATKAAKKSAGKSAGKSARKPNGKSAKHSAASADTPDGAAPAKRRGRPPKVVTSHGEAAAPRKRGRPRKNPVAVEAPAEAT